MNLLKTTKKGFFENLKASQNIVKQFTGSFEKMFEYLQNKKENTFNINFLNDEKNFLKIDKINSNSIIIGGSSLYYNYIKQVYYFILNNKKCYFVDFGFSGCIYILID